MCDVCCATKAIEKTAEGAEAVFWWRTTTPAWRPDSSPTWPPRDAGDPPPAAPRLHVQAEGKAEGPGRVRFRFPEGEWSDWIETADVAGTMMCLHVDVKWRYVPKDHPLRRRDAPGLFAKVAESTALHAAWHYGNDVAMALVHARRVVPARVEALAAALKDGTVDKDHPDEWVRGFLSGLVVRLYPPRGRLRQGPTRKASPGSHPAT